MVLVAAQEERAEFCARSPAACDLARTGLSAGNETRELRLKPRTGCEIGAGRGTAARVALRDRSTLYGDRAVGIMLGPVDLPSPQAIRDRLDRFSTYPGLERLASRLDTKRGRWLPIAAADREDYLARAVVDLRAEDDAAFASWATTALSESASDASLRISVGAEYVGIALSHAVGDALSVHQLFPALYAMEFEDLPRTIVGHPPKALLVRALAHHYGRDPGRALRLVRSDRTPHRRPSGREAAAAVASQRPSAGEWDFVATCSPPGFARELRQRQRAHGGASPTSMLFAAARRILFEQVGWPADSSMQILCDARRYLPRRIPGYLGNFATGITLCVPDARDGAAIDRELRLALDSGRPLAAMLLAGKTAFQRGEQPADDSHDGMPTLCFTHHGKLRSYEKLSWRADPGGRRFWAPARPNRGTALTFAFAELSNVVHVSASFDRRLFTRRAVEQVLEELCGDVNGIIRRAA